MKQKYVKYIDIAKLKSGAPRLCLLTKSEHFLSRNPIETQYLLSGQIKKNSCYTSLHYSATLEPAIWSPDTGLIGIHTGMDVRTVAR